MNQHRRFSVTTDKQAQELLLQEFKEAWVHYRHVETTRSAYLGFFFTVTFGVLSFVTSILAKDSAKENVLFAVLILGWVLNLTTTCIYGAIHKCGVVLAHYETIMNRVRKIVYGGAYSEMHALLYVRESPNPVMRLPFFSVQKTAERILVIAQVILGGALASACALGWHEGHLRDHQLVILGVLLVSLIVCQLHLAIRLLLSKRYIRKD